MELNKTTSATATSAPRSVSKSTKNSSTPARQNSPQPARDRATINREPEATGKQPINFGSWATPGKALRKGVEADPQVRDLQKALKVKVDGKFGPDTERAVREFQKNHDLKVDGLVGSDTARALNNSTPAAGASPSPASSRPAAPTSTADRRKVDAFSFSSTPQSPQAVKDFIGKSKAAGKTPMIGIDPNNEPEKQAKIAKLAHEQGAQTHKYLEGPGGPTGDGPNPKWERSEYERTRALAAKEGIRLPEAPAGQKHFNVDDRNPAMKAWNDQGWQRQAISQAREAKREGHSSVEVDNINRDFKGQDNSDEAKAGRAMEFYRKYAGEFQKGDMPTLMLKNLSKAELEAVSKGISNFERTKDFTPEQLAKLPPSVRDNRLPRAMFSDFSINEYEAKMSPGRRREEMMSDLTGRERLTRQLGIEPLRSGDTYNYAARS
ncbi:MAG: peptidoglycan-binding domain-containing protein [Vulcanimicrobiota bacterium]